MRAIVLGVSGSVAAYRAADLARDLMRCGFTVRVCLTDAASKFVSAALFEALTGQPCLQDAFEEPERGRMAHIDWARQAELMLVAPATANTISKLAWGVGDDMLTTLALAYTGPIVIAPAMNPSMYQNAATQDSIRIMGERGAVFVEPQEGDVACGEHGEGKLATNAEIVSAALAVANRSDLLKGKHVLITSGPTQEPLDEVRYLTNRSSGRMGAALARAALWMGAKVTVVTGPTSVTLPLQADIVRVRTALEMLDAALAYSEANVIIGAAAVADYRPANRIQGKLRRGEAPNTIELTENPDVIGTLARSTKEGALVLGFAAEPGTDMETAREKIKRKGLSAIAINDISRGDVGFESQFNELTLLMADGREERSGKRTKLACALWLLDQVVNREP